MEGTDRYVDRWKNRRARRANALRKERYGSGPGEEGHSDEAEELAVYEPSDAPKHGSVGVLAGMSYPNYSILVGGRFLPGRTDSTSDVARFKHLVIGDKGVFDASAQNPTINGMVARRSQLARLRADTTRRSVAGAEEQVFAANVDIAVIVASATRPAFRTGLVDRYLVTCRYGNIKPLLCITKLDLAPMPDLSIYKNAEVPIVGVSTVTREGLDRLMPYIEGHTCVLVGNSGVGKSTLINALLKSETIPTQEVGKKSGEWRHTTSAAALHLIDKSTFLIDTPGIRSLGLRGIDRRSLRLYFPEFAEFAPECEFGDCAHAHEPDCAVKRAVEEGLIPRERYDSYIRLLADG